MLYADAFYWFIFFYGPLATILASFIAVLQASTTPAASPSFLTASYLAKLQVPALTLLCLSFTLIRAYEGPIMGGSFFLSAHGSVWAVCIFGALALLFTSSGLWLAGWRGSWSPELFTSLSFLAHFWVLAALTRSFFSFVLLLELSGLCLLLLILVGGGDKGSLAQAPMTSHVSTALTFLWVSIFALFAMMWGAWLSLPLVGSFQFDVLKTLQPFYEPTSGAALLLGFALLLKLMVLPWQSALFAFYRGLPLQALLLYMVCYYPPFLALGCFALMPLSAALSPAAALLLFAVMGGGAFAVGLTQTPAMDLRVALALSSFFNMALLLAATLLSV